MQRRAPTLGSRSLPLTRLRPGRAPLNVAEMRIGSGIEPVFDETVRYGLPWRHEFAVRGRQGCAREPARVLQYLIAQAHLGGDRVRGEPEHQRSRERPRLGRVIFDPVDFDAGFLEYLARHRVFERFSRLDEAGDGGVAPDRPGGLPSQEGALRIADQHDDGRIDPRELLMAAARIAAHEHMSALR